jgi:pimeloyl-ACP methyl ester carboxylesterase
LTTEQPDQPRGEPDQPQAKVSVTPAATGTRERKTSDQRKANPAQPLVPLPALFGILLLAIALIPSSTASASFEAKSQLHRCSDTRDKTLRLNLKVGGEKTFGYFALPDRKPKGLAVFEHGWTHSAITWRPNLKRVATRDGVVAVAMNYRHQRTNLDPTSPEYGRSRGYRVIEGAKDSIAAARYMLRRCGRLEKRTVVAYGVSMGGNASGLAVSSRAKRPGGKRPLFDYWFDIEGITNVVQEYLGARALSGVIPDAAKLAADIEEDFGGTYEERTGFYKRHAIVNRAPDIKASGIKGVVLVHATDDSEVPYSQSKDMFDRLHAVGVRSQLFTVNPSGAPVDHGSEIDRTHPVIKTGFDRLAALFNHGIRPRCFQEFAVDGASGAITPDPASAAC